MPHQLRLPNVVRFANKLDGLLDLLNVTADARAATGSEISGEAKFHAGTTSSPRFTDDFLVSESSLSWPH